MLIINDISKFKITKLKPNYAMYFTYNNHKYLLHSKSDCGDKVTTLYKRNLIGNSYKLEVVSSVWWDYFDEIYSVINKNYTSINGTPTYSHIDKIGVLRVLDKWNLIKLKEEI